MSPDTTTSKAVVAVRNVSAIPWDLQMASVTFVRGSVSASLASVENAVSNANPTTLALDQKGVNHVIVTQRAPFHYSVKRMDVASARMVS